MKNDLKSVVKRECCNYYADGPHNTLHHCAAKDKMCPVFGEFSRCRWFEDAVLPAWPDVAAEYAELCGQPIGRQ